MDASQIIDAAGGVSQVARDLRVATSSVSNWRKNGIPPRRVLQIRKIRPELKRYLLSGRVPGSRHA